MIRCECGRECRHICPDCLKELGAANGNTLNSLVGLLRRVHDEIDALDEGIPMSAYTWDEMEDALQAIANRHRTKMAGDNLEDS